MSGLDQILKTIEADAQAAADAVVSKAKLEAEEILAEAKREAEVKCGQIAAQSEAGVKAAVSRAESSAALQERKILLGAKQRIIGNIIAAARERLDRLPDTEYTDIILSTIKKYAHNQAGKLILSDKDRRRLTLDFQERLAASLRAKPDAALVIAEEKPNFEGGFLLVYGELEENCSFDALFAQEREQLQDKVNSLLFD